MERLIDSVNFDDQESLNWFHRTLRRLGVIDRLREVVPDWRRLPDDLPGAVDFVVPDAAAFIVYSDPVAAQRAVGQEESSRAVGGELKRAAHIIFVCIIFKCI